MPVSELVVTCTILKCIRDRTSGRVGYMLAHAIRTCASGIALATYTTTFSNQHHAVKARTLSTEGIGTMHCSICTLQESQERGKPRSDHLVVAISARTLGPSASNSWLHIKLWNGGHGEWLEPATEGYRLNNTTTTTVVNCTDVSARLTRADARRGGLS